MGRYRSKPVEIEAVQLKAVEHGRNPLTGEREHDPIFNSVYAPGWLRAAFAAGAIQIITPRESDWVHLDIHTANGVVRASPGDWICQDTDGFLYPCKDSVFRAKYEEI